MVLGRRVVFSLLGAIAFAVALTAQSPVRYIYDELGRLVGVIDPSGNAAAYHYDAVGNLLSITRSTPTTVAIIEVTPDGGPGGQTVTIYGTGFSATVGQNTVTFNGTSASIASASTTQLVVTVPGGATTGTIGVTSPNGSATSSAAFVVGASLAPTIAGFSPAIGTAGTAVTVSGANFETTAALNRLGLNLARTVLTSVSATSLATTVPAGVASGRFSVSTPNGTVLSATDFFVPPSPFVASDVVTTARLAFGVPQNIAIGTAHTVALAVFDGTQAQRISVKLVPGPIGQFKLYTPSQSVWSSNGVSIGTLLVEPNLLPTTGTYQILLDPVGTGTGTTAVTLYDVPADISGMIDDNGIGVAVTTTVPGQNASLAFGGTASQRVSLMVSSGPSSRVSLRRPDGSEQAHLATSGIFNAFLEPQTLTTTGFYAIDANPTGIATGTLTLTLYHVPADISGTIDDNGIGVAVTTTVPGQNASLAFGGTASQRVSLMVSSGPSSRVSLRRPDGSEQAHLATSGIFNAFLEPQTLTTAGFYAIDANPTGIATGTLTLTLYDVPAEPTGTVTIGGAAVGVSLLAPGQNGTLTFSGTASQQVTVRMTDHTIALTTVRLRKPDGTQLTSVSGNGSSFNLAATLPTTGTYTIEINPSGPNTGHVNVAVTNP